jgi:hypothetical protein
MSRSGRALRTISLNTHNIISPIFAAVARHYRKTCPSGPPLSASFPLQSGSSGAGTLPRRLVLHPCVHALHCSALVLPKRLDHIHHGRPRFRCPFAHALLYRQVSSSSTTVSSKTCPSLVHHGATSLSAVRQEKGQRSFCNRPLQEQKGPECSRNIRGCADFLLSGCASYLGITSCASLLITTSRISVRFFAASRDASREP